MAWNHTTLILVELADGGGRHGMGWTYASRATGDLIHDELAAVVRGEDAMATGRAFANMVARVRNLGRPGAAMMAISAVDIALWDLKAQLLSSGFRSASCSGWYATRSRSMARADSPATTRRASVRSSAAGSTKASRG